MKQFSLFILVIMSAGFVFINQGCKSKASDNKEYEFYYYPEKNLYYNVSSKKFFYSLDSARTWNEMSGVINDSTLLGKKEVIYSGNDSAWKDNESHRKLYSGIIYNINNTSVNDSEVTAVKERKGVKKTSKGRTRKPVVEKVKKQPVKDFFKKIFGKRKKKEG